MYAQPAKLGVREVGDSWSARATTSGKSRVAAIDLARLVAAAGVISVHILPDTDGFETVTEVLAPFRTPVFIGVALWFQQQRMERLGPEVGVLASLQQGVLWSRLVVPYCVWSIIYVLARSAKAITVGPAWDIDWLAVTCFGASAVHLYFIPFLLALCVVQSCVLRGSPPLQRPVALSLLLAMAALDGLSMGSLRYGFDQSVLWNGLVFGLALKAASEFAGQPRDGFHREGQVAGNVALCAGLYIAACWVQGESPMVYQGLCALLVAAVLSLLSIMPMPSLPAWITWAARASFGIYLSHHLIIEGVELGLQWMGMDLAPYDSMENILLTLCVIATALLMVALVRQSVWLSFLLLGESRKA